MATAATIVSPDGHGGVGAAGVFGKWIAEICGMDRRAMRGLSLMTLVRLDDARPGRLRAPRSGS